MTNSSKVPVVQRYQLASSSRRVTSPGSMRATVEPLVAQIDPAPAVRPLTSRR